LSNAAVARDFGHHHGSHSGSEEFKYKRFGGGDFRHNRYRYGHRHHDGRGLALGAFAAIVGLAIAAEANRVNHDDYYDEY
jgi:hypothetical protein